MAFTALLVVESGCNRLAAPAGPSSTSSISLTASQADNALGSNLYNFYDTQSGNIFFSPFSIITALAMAQEGAAGDTASQMQQVLGLSSDAATRQQTFQQLISAINAPGKSYTLDTADDLWPQKGFSIIPSYLNVVQNDYFAGVTAVDYVGDASGAVQTINGAVSQQTEGYIPNLLSISNISVKTKLILTNAIYFKADWQNEFDVMNTRTGNFTLPTSAAVPVSMMSEDLHAHVGSYNGVASVLALPYKNNQASMYIFLPPAGGMAALESQLSASNLNNWLMANAATMTGSADDYVALSLPRFTFSSSYELSSTLSQMGMPLAFDGKSADFSGIDGAQDLYISEVIHKAYIDVTESGTTAAAATAVVVTRDSIAPMEAQESFAVDYPFIFLIVDNATNTVLFMGRIENPLQAS
ncbi:MAG: serpin family protein [bacterium]